MKEKNKVVCQACGCISVEYRFCFNKGLAKFFECLYKEGKPVKTDSLNLTYSQRTNSQKLRYWGLAVPCVGEDSKKKAGWWQITKMGIDFMQGNIKIPKYAFTIKGTVTKLDGPMISFSEVNDGYDYRADYAKQARDQIQSEFGF